MEKNEGDKPPLSGLEGDVVWGEVQSSHQTPQYSTHLSTI